MLEKQALLTGPLMWMGTVTAAPADWGPEKWSWLICSIIGAMANAYVLVMVKRWELAKKQSEEKTNEAE